MTKYTDDREGRARLIFDMLAPIREAPCVDAPYSSAMCSRGTKSCNGIHNPEPSAFVRGVEWYENRPSPGYSPAECLHWCLVRNQTVAFAEWARVPEDAQRLYKSAAGTLRAHGTVR